MKKLIVAVSLLILASCNQTPQTPKTAEKTSGSANAKIEKAFISFRIGVPLWSSEKRYTEVLDLFGKYRGVTDEITFFTSATHPPLPLNRQKLLQRNLERRYSCHVTLWLLETKFLILAQSLWSRSRQQSRMQNASFGMGLWVLPAVETVLWGHLG